MKGHFLLNRILTVAVTLFAATTSLQAEPADDFLEGLRQRGWHDTALEYLDQAKQDPLVTPAFLQKVGYERAVTQAVLARESVNEQQRQTLLARAAEDFQQFATDQPESPWQTKALSTAGSLLTENAISLTNKAEKLPRTAKRQREKLFASSRKMLGQAKQPLQTLLEQCDNKIKALPSEEELQDEPQDLAKLRQLRAKQAEAQFLLAKLNFEKSRTYASDSKTQEKYLEKAADDFAQIYERYYENLVGFYGRLYQGRCYQSAGKPKKALECYFDLIDQPPSPNRDFRRLISRAYRRRAECHLVNGDLELAIKECREWLDESHGAELSEPAWLAVMYQLANACERQADISSGGDAKRLLTEARKYFREVSKAPNEFQREAKAKLASKTTAELKAIEVHNFDDAFTAGKDALGQMNASKLTARLAMENNPDSVESLEQEALANRAAAMRYFTQALQLADGQTDQERLVTTRYYLCWLNWEMGQLDDAAVLGEYVARRYSESKFAPLAAKLALAAYERMYNTSKQAGKAAEFESERLTAMAELLVKNWPESPEAATGLNLLINISLRDNRLNEAEQLLERLPASSRAAAELRLGGALWTRYLRASQNSQTGPIEAINELKQKANILLSRGYQSLHENSSPSAAEATGVLYYVQLLLARGNAKEAVRVLENDSVGPLTLVQNESEAATRPEFILETYKVALRAYASVEPPQRDEVQAMMAALEAAIGTNGNSQQKLISIYVSLGMQLQQQIKMLTDAGQSGKASAVAAAFEDLLGRITQRVGASDNWKVQSWIAQTNLQIGQGLEGEDAARYYQQAEQAYSALLSKAKQDPTFAPSPIAILSTRKRLADCLLSLAKHEDAFQQYASILQEKPSMLELQLSAATALQQWGTVEKNGQKLEESIRGSLPQANKKNLVWGWLRLAAIADHAKRRAEKKAAADPGQASTVEKYKNLFFKARFNAAKARLETARLKQGNEKKKQLQTARKSLASMQRLYPNLGGPTWQSAYASLLKEIEQE